MWRAGSRVHSRAQSPVATGDPRPQVQPNRMHFRIDFEIHRSQLFRPCGVVARRRRTQTRSRRRSGYRVRSERTSGRTGSPPTACAAARTATARSSRWGPTAMAGLCARPSVRSARSSRRFKWACGGRPACPPAGRTRPFHELASRWWFARKSKLRPTTQADYEWRLRKHLLPFFADINVSAITIALVDEYRSEKVIERERIRAAADAGRPIRDKRGQRRVALSSESINKTRALLANILHTAVEHGLRASNPARGKRRRLKADRPTRRFLEADELAGLLAVAASSIARRGPIGGSAGGR